MPRPPYCLPEDVLRLFDAQESLVNFDEAELGLIRDSIDDFGSEFEIETGHAFRETRVGSPGSPETYEYASVEGNHRRPPLRLLLDHRFIHPIDPNQDDVVEYRSGRDEWTDISDASGDEFTLKYEHGAMKVFRWLINRIVWGVPDDRYLRLSYRYGGLGGKQGQGGQTTLDGAVDSSSTSITVDNAGRLPSSGKLLLYGDNAEYVDLESVNYDTNTITVSRGERSTDAASHDDGDVVHYCPLSFRKSVAGKAAQEMQEYEFFAANLSDTGDGISGSDRIDTWSAKFDRSKAKHSTVKKL